MPTTDPSDPATDALTFTVSLSVDVLAWLEEYGHNTNLGEARDDARQLLPQMISEAITSHPWFRSYATNDLRNHDGLVSTPIVALLDADAIEQAGRQARLSHNLAKLVQRCRELASVDDSTGDAPLAILFSAVDYDNGWFIVDPGSAYYADGTIVSGQITDPDLDDILADISSAYSVGSRATLLVDLRTGSADFNEYGHDPRTIIGTEETRVRNLRVGDTFREFGDSEDEWTTVATIGGGDDIEINDQSARDGDMVVLRIKR